MTLRAITTSLALAAAAASAQAAGVEDTFRDYIARLRAGGQALREAPLALGQHEIGRPVIDKRIDQLPLGRDEYVVFVAPGCRRCAHAVQSLRSRGVAVHTLDLARSTTAREAFALVGGQGVPTVLVGNYRLSGYSDRAFKEALVRGATDYGQEMKGQGP